MLIREHLVKGQSDAQIVDFVVARYGDYVLLKPRLTSETVILWGTPFAVLIIAGLALLLRRRPPPAPEQPLSEAEQAAFRKTME